MLKVAIDVSATKKQAVASKEEVAKKAEACVIYVTKLCNLYLKWRIEKLSLEKDQTNKKENIAYWEQFRRTTNV